MSERIDEPLALELIAQIYDASLQQGLWEEVMASATAYFEAAPAGDATVARLAAIAPHLARAVGVMQRLHDAETAGRVTRASLDRLTCGALLLGAAGEVLFVNRAARRILQERDGIGIGPGPGRSAARRLVIRDGGARAKVSAMLGARSGCASIPRPSGRPACLLQCAPIGRRAGFHVTGAGCVMAFLTDPATRVSLDRGPIRALYHLTPAELALVERLCGGERLGEAARRLGIAENTARSHLKSAFLKTGVRRQAELVRLFLGLGAPPPPRSGPVVPR